MSLSFNPEEQKVLLEQKVAELEKAIVDNRAAAKQRVLDLGSVLYTAWLEDRFSEDLAKEHFTAVDELYKTARECRKQIPVLQAEYEERVKQYEAEKAAAEEAARIAAEEAAKAETSMAIEASAVVAKPTAAPEFKFCTECGERNKRVAKFCRSCGSKFEA